MIDNQQMAADLLKGLVGRNNQRAIEAIKRLEKCGWHGGAFADAMATVGAAYDENGFSFSVDIGHSVERLIATYLDLVGCEERDPFADIFDTRAAADYLGISYNTLKQYASRDKRIEGKKVGQTMLYSRQQLDQFKRSMRPVGKPKANEDAG